MLAAREEGMDLREQAALYRAEPRPGAVGGRVDAPWHSVREVRGAGDYLSRPLTSRTSSHSYGWRTMRPTNSAGFV